MKFGKRIREVVESSYPEWAPHFMRYKELKQLITAPGSDSLGSSDDTPASMPSHRAFFALLTTELERVNEFFLDKEEECIIEHGECMAAATAVVSMYPRAPDHADALLARLLDLHGELVLLENFSTVNYTGFRKILKKHQKKTGIMLRSAYLVSVVTTPFFLSDTTRKLVLSVERLIARLSSPPVKRRRPNPNPPAPPASGSASTAAETLLRAVALHPLHPGIRHPPYEVVAALAALTPADLPLCAPASSGDTSAARSVVLSPAARFPPPAALSARTLMVARLLDGTATMCGVKDACTEKRVVTGPADPVVLVAPVGSVEWTATSECTFVYITWQHAEGSVAENDDLGETPGEMGGQGDENIKKYGKSDCLVHKQVHASSEKQQSYSKESEQNQAHEQAHAQVAQQQQSKHLEDGNRVRIPCTKASGDATGGRPAM